MKILAAILLLFTTTVNAQVLVVRLCGEPVLFLYDYKNQMYVIPVDKLDDVHGERILDQIRAGKFTVFESEAQTDKAVCGIEI